MAEILGHIDCPSCGTKGGMRITHDKNGDPFGFCEAECNQQMRIGGNPRRVALFLKMYPWAAGAAESVPVTVTDAPEPEAPKPEAKPKREPKPRVGFAFGL